MRTEDRSVEFSIFNIDVHQFSQYLEIAPRGAFTMFKEIIALSHSHLGCLIFIDSFKDLS